MFIFDIAQTGTHYSKSQPSNLLKYKWVCFML